MVITSDLMRGLISQVKKGSGFPVGQLWMEPSSGADVSFIPPPPPPVHPLRIIGQSQVSNHFQYTFEKKTVSHWPVYPRCPRRNTKFI